MIGFYACIVMVPCFWLLALFFAVGRERAANWLSGFHGLSKEEKAKYDRARMARDERNACFLPRVLSVCGNCPIDDMELVFPLSVGADYAARGRGGAVDYGLGGTGGLWNLDGAVLSGRASGY